MRIAVEGDVAVKFEFANIIVFMAVGALFILVNNVMSKLFHTKIYSSEKHIPYECGEDPVDDARLKFNIRFYTTALIFLLFDVEIAFLFPWGVVFKQIGLLAFVEMFIFIFILLVGLGYVWAKGDLDWVRSYRTQEPPQEAEEEASLLEAAD